MKAVWFEEDERIYALNAFHMEHIGNVPAARIPTRQLPGATIGDVRAFRGPGFFGHMECILIEGDVMIWCQVKQEQES